MSDTYSAPHTDIALGEGRWIVGHAIYQGTPAIIFTPATAPGEPDTDASNQIPADKVSEGAVVLRFTTMDAMLRHLDRMKAMAEQFEAAVKKATALPGNDGTST